MHTRSINPSYGPIVIPFLELKLNLKTAKSSSKSNTNLRKNITIIFILKIQTHYTVFNEHEYIYYLNIHIHSLFPLTLVKSSRTNKFSWHQDAKQASLLHTRTYITYHPVSHSTESERETRIVTASHKKDKREADQMKYYFKGGRCV